MISVGGPRRRAVGSLRRLLGVAAVCLFLPAGASAQSQSVLAELELEYRSAESAFTAAVEARAAAEARWQRANNEIEAARAAGDEDRIDRAYATFQNLAIALMVQDERLLEAESNLDAAREALLTGLRETRDALYEEARASDSPVERRELAALIADLGNRLREVEGDGLRIEQAELVSFPQIIWDPRDGPTELRNKAEWLERKAAQYETRMEEYDGRIEELERRRRQERDLQNLVAGVNRFDDARVPVGAADEPPTAPESGEEGSAALPDSATVGQPALGLEQQIEQLRRLRDQMEGYRERALTRARVFREQLERISG